MPYELDPDAYAEYESERDGYRIAHPEPGEHLGSPESFLAWLAYIDAALADAEPDTA